MPHALIQQHVRELGLRQAESSIEVSLMRPQDLDGYFERIRLFVEPHPFDEGRAIVDLQLESPLDATPKPTVTQRLFTGTEHAFAAWIADPAGVTALIAQRLPELDRALQGQDLGLT